MLFLHFSYTCKPVVILDRKHRDKGREGESVCIYMYNDRSFLHSAHLLSFDHACAVVMYTIQLCYCYNNILVDAFEIDHACVYCILLLYESVFL